tara:strand:- start:62 stop:814 length:753 start_codon:yes stop_codon:yes gene_type:complete
METPFYGRPKMTQHLRDLGYWVNSKRVGRLMKLMGIQGVRPRLNTSKPHPDHKVYPYLLRGLDIIKTNQVWATDITYIRLKRGFMYLVAVIDIFSRYVISWQLSNTLDTEFCIEALNEALGKSRTKPAIFNTDQGAQFTSYAFTEVLLKNDIRISMDGKGRAIDNVFIERLWWSVKYECTYLHSFETVSELREALTSYFDFYNNRRYHQSLKYKKPKEVYFGESATKMMDYISCGNVENSSSLRTVPLLR